MTPTDVGGATDIAVLMDQGEYGALVPAGQARKQLEITSEHLRRFGDEAEGLLNCRLPTSRAGGRQYPEQLLVLMAEARAEQASGRAASRKAALAKLLVHAGWIDGTSDEQSSDLGDVTVLRELVADLQALKRSLAGVAPGLLGAAEEQREITDEMLETMRRATLELPQVQHHLERMQANHVAQAETTRHIGQQALELMHHTADLHRPQRALELELMAIRRTLQSVIWALGLGGLGVAGLVVLIMRG